MKKKKYQLKITIYGYNVTATEEAVRLVAGQLHQLKLSFNGPTPLPLPTETKSCCVLISPHKYKKSQEQFDRKTHKRVFFIYSSVPPSNLKSLENLKVPNTASFRLRASF